MAAAKPEIDPDRARELLREARERIEADLAEVARFRRSAVDEIDTATAAEDDADAIEDEARDQARETQLRRELDAIERAERRLADGTYGLSVVSRKPIPAKRLEAIPWADRTAEEERRGGGG